MRNLFYIVMAFMLLIPLSAHAHKHEIHEPKVHIVNPYAFGTMPGATTGAAFMKIVNKGPETDYLVSAKASFAKITELHENLIDPDDGKMMMRKVRKIEIPHEGEAMLHPKGHHVMFIKLKEPLILGTTLKVTLKFNKSGIYEVNVPVVQPGMIPKEVEQEEEKTAEENHEEWPPRYRGADEDQTNSVYRKIK